MQVLYHVCITLSGRHLFLYIFEKRCNTCLHFKSFDDYHSKANTWDGMHQACKECRKDSRIRSFSSLRHTSPDAKFCTKCLKEKLYKEFDRGTAPDGYQSHCKECRSEHNRQFRLDHHDALLAYDRSRVGDGERKKQHNRLYREVYSQDPEFIQKQRQSKDRWYQANPLIVREQWMRRDARKKGVRVGRVSYKRILKRDGYYCYICDNPILSHHRLEFDHRIPLLPRKGEPQGTHTEDNIHPSHAECNGRKSNRRFEDLTDYEKRGVDY